MWLRRAPHLDIFSSPTEKDVKIAEDSLKSLNILHMKDKPYTESVVENSSWSLLRGS